MRSFLPLLVCEWRKQVALLRVQWVAILVRQLLFLLLFLLLVKMATIIADGVFDATAQAILLVGFLTWRATTGYMEEVVNTLADEVQDGTLEHLWLGNGSLTMPIMVKILVLFTLHTIWIGLLAIILIPVLSLSFDWSIDALFIFILAGINITGITLCLIGLQLVYKQTAFITNLLGFLLFFLTGAFFPVDFTGALYHFSRFLPLSDGIALLRAILINGQTTADPTLLPLLGGLVINSVVYGLIGIAVLRWAYKRVAQSGLLAQ